MTMLFHFIDESLLSPDAARYRVEAEEYFTRLDEMFAQFEASPRRLKVAREFPMPTLAAPYELATVYSLRALELAEGAAGLIEGGNHAAAFPVLRSLYEIWTAVAFAVTEFEKLVLRSNKWAKFDALAEQLILGANGRPSGPNAIKTSRMVGAADRAMKHFGASDSEVGDSLSKQHKQAYAELCDGSHPTQWGIIAHAEFRNDGLGITWKRKPDEVINTGHIIDLALSLRLSVEWIRRLGLTAEEIEEAAKRAEKQDPSIREATITFLERVLDDPALELSEESRERSIAVLNHLREQRDS